MQLTEPNKSTQLYSSSKDKISSSTTAHLGYAKLYLCYQSWMMNTFDMCSSVTQVTVSSFLSSSKLAIVTLSALSNILLHRSFVFSTVHVYIKHLNNIIHVLPTDNKSRELKSVQFSSLSHDLVGAFAVLALPSILSSSPLVHVS